MTDPGMEGLVSSAAQAAGGWLGALPIAQVATSADGTIVRWNRAAADLLGYGPQQVMGRHIADLLHPGVDRTLGRSLWEAATNRRGVMGTVTAWHADGHPLELEIWACPVPDQYPGPSALLVFAADAHAARRIRGSSAVWDGLFTRSPVGIGVLDTELRFLQVNPALEQMNGLSQAAHIGRRLTELLPEVNAHEMEEAMRQVLETGLPILDLRRTGRTPARPDRDRVWSCSYVRVEDPGGRPIGVVATLLDITEKQQAQVEAEAGRRRLALLSEASMRIGSSLEVERTAQELADLAVGRLADAVTVDVLESLARGDDTGSGLAGGTALRRLGKAPLTGSAVVGVLAPVGRTLTFPYTAPYTQALSARRPFVVPRLDEEVIAPAGRHTSRPARLLALGVHSMMMVPLVARETVLGVAGFYRTNPSGPFAADDVTLASELAARAAVGIDNARLYHREHDTALTLQRSMLPQHISPPPGVEVAHRYLPASDVNEVGGDWYDVLRLPGGRAAFLIGDVMGHGTAAAAVMGRLSASVRALARLDLPPPELLRQLEAALEDLADPMLATMCYVVTDPATGRCSVARAGHPPPALLAPGRDARLLDIPPDPPLGVGHPRYTTTHLTLEPGSILVLYTDGLIEARGSDIDERLAELTGTLSEEPHPTLAGLADGLLARLVPASADDDIALLIARIEPP